MSDDNRNEPPEGMRVLLYLLTFTLQDGALAACWAHADKQRAIGAAQERARIDGEDTRRLNESLRQGRIERGDLP